MPAVHSLSSAPARVIVREVNWLGDIVMSLPALRAIRAAYPQAHLAVLIKKELAGFFDGSSWIDEVIPFKFGKGLKGLSDRLKLARALRAKRFELGIMFPNSFDSALLFAKAGIKRRVGYARDGRSFLLTDRLKPNPAILEVHQVHYYLNLLKETLQIKGSSQDFRPDPSAPNVRRMEGWLQQKRLRPNDRLYALGVAAAYGPAKEWPATYYARLIELLEDRQIECVLVGSPNERAKAEQVLHLSNSKAIIAAGETNMGEALALLSLCDGFIGNDSGSMHVAGALGLPTLGIFGSTRAERTGPLGAKARTIYEQIHCSPCLQRTCRYEHYDCLKILTPEKVINSFTG